MDQNHIFLVTLHLPTMQLMIGKTFWKSLALPSFLYGANIFYLTEEEMKKLEIIENGVYRQILGAPRYTANCALRGEVGASMTQARAMKGHLQYARNNLQGNNQLLKEVTETQLEEKSTKWAKMIISHLELLKLKVSNLRNMGKEELNKKVVSWDDDKWRKEVESKSRLKIYKKWKVKIKEDNIYDNTQGSVVLFQARTDTLPLKARKRFTKEDTKCPLCEAENENLEHFLLKCPELSETRVESTELQQLYREDKEEVIMNFLFDENKKNMEEKKCNLFRMWKQRKRKLKELNTTRDTPQTNHRKAQ